MNNIMLFEGKGIFTWDGAERRSDRYGSFTLDNQGYCSGSFPEASWLGDIHENVGKRVKIEVTVLETQKSGHTGDLYRGIFPTTPEVGETIILGIGELFIQKEDWSASKFAIGVKPSDGRANDWFEPSKLYRLHDQTVMVKVFETDQPNLIVGLDVAG